MSRTISRRRFTASAGGVLLGSALPLGWANAAEFVFKWGTNVPETHPLNVYARKAAEAIKQETNGRFELQVFPNNQLGGDTDMFSQLRSGGLECFTLSGVNVLSTILPSAAIYGIGFAFPNYETLWKALDGQLGAYLRSQITSKAGLVVMDKIWDNGFRQITSSTKPITKPADLQGFKIRVPVSALWTSLFKALGAAPTGINFAEVYSALQTKIVDDRRILQRSFGPPNSSKCKSTARSPVTCGTVGGSSPTAGRGSACRRISRTSLPRTLTRPRWPSAPKWRSRTTR